MTYLFIDTAANHLIISIVKNMEMIYYIEEENNKTLSSRIMPIIDKAFKEANTKPNDIDTIFVVTGPGSFTGIRVGVTIAKTMAWGLNKKIIPLSELELMATIHVDTDYIAPIIDARRGYVFGGVYDKELNNIIPDTHILLEDFKNQLPDNTTIVSSGKCDILKIISKHENSEGVNSHALKPNYLKKTEAEENL